MNPTRSFSAFGISLGVHIGLLIALWMIRYNMVQNQPDVAVETIFTDERVQQEFSQELELDTTVAETMNPVASSAMAATAGTAGGPPVSQAKIETSESLKEPELRVNLGPVNMLSSSELATEMGGQGEVEGEVGAMVPGYGAALSRITQELVRMMREQRVLVVWLFDESESMKDDQEEIRQNFHKVYDELGLAQKEVQELRRGKEILLTSIVSYGAEPHLLTPKPTSDVEEIKAAIGKIPIDESGKENMCQTIMSEIARHRSVAVRDKRKMVVIVVSDESGSDGQYVENALNEANKAKAPIYVLGREAIFGYPYARVRWQDPKYKLWHWLRIDRGPETAFPECLQWDGLHARHDAFSSGFGPYEMVRLAKETGGVYFVLPSEEEDLTGAGANEKRKFEALAMKEYQPMLLSRREYAAERDRSKFRKTVWDVIVTLNPNKNEQLPGHDPLLNIREHWYPLDQPGFREAASKEVQKAARAMSLLNTAIPLLESVRPLRDTEDFQRWRANYDLMYAQTIAYRVRLFQYLLAMDQHANANPYPKPKKATTNRWNVGRTRNMLVPDDAQFERLKKAFKIRSSKDEYLQMLKEQEQQARDMYAAVMEEHAGTPWARRAKYELDKGFGMQFYEAFRNPNYEKRDIKLPKF